MDTEYLALYSSLLATTSDLEQQYEKRQLFYSETYKTISIIKERKLNNSCSTSSSNQELANNSEIIEEIEQRVRRPRYSQNVAIKQAPIIEETLKFEPIEKDNNIIIGRNGTEIKLENYKQINWKSPSAATRTLLLNVFGETQLSTHSLSGRPSPAFVGRERPSKNQLDSKKVHDIVNVVRFKFNITERDVRAYITTKCSDAAKLLRYKAKKANKMEKKNKIST